MKEKYEAKKFHFLKYKKFFDLGARFSRAWA